MVSCLTVGALPRMQRGEKRRPAQCRPRCIPFDQAYIMGARLGEGTTATVRAGLVKGSARRVAVKVFCKADMSPADVECMLNEATLLQSIRRPDILRVIDVVEDYYRYYMVMDRMSGDLFERITDKVTYSEVEARVLMRNVLNAVGYLHDNNIVHRDLKPENILMRSDRDDLSVAIGDFGFAARLKSDDERLTYPCGTQCYVAPEILKQEPYGKEVDVWSLGVVLFVVLGGYPPFAVSAVEPRRRLLEKIKRGAYSFDGAVWNYVSADAKDLIMRMLTVDPAQRITVRQALQHPWLAQAVRKPQPPVPSPTVECVTDMPARSKTPIVSRMQKVLSSGLSTLLHKLKVHEQNVVKVLIKAQ